MIQLFFQKQKISAKEWAKAYRRIDEITTSFPLKLVRVEAYKGYEATLDKDHFDLKVNVGEPHEHISFYGDWLSFTFGTTTRFYKNWKKQQNTLSETINPFTYYEDPKNSIIYEENKPVTWYLKSFVDDGSPCIANGAMGRYGSQEGGSLPYEYVILAIGIMLENLFPGRVFMVADEHELETMEKLVAWLEAHYKEDFDLPIYFDKLRLLASFIAEYEDKKDAVGRMEHLFHKQFKRNMEFALKHIGYQPTFDFYTEVLAYYNFGTWGFDNVFDPWIAVTQDLESALNLLSASQALLFKNDKTGKAEKYDLTQILKKLLHNFVLWTPLEREQLAVFYTNKEALETGKEDLWGTILNMSGHRANICPIYATEQELFEAFMYHDPQNGAVFKEIIATWIAENANAYENLKQKIAEERQKALLEKANEKPENESLAKEVAQGKEVDEFLRNYSSEERYFVINAVMLNIEYIRVKKGVAEMRQALKKMIKDPINADSVAYITSQSKAEKIKVIKNRLKEVRLCVHAHFEKWLEEEEDENVLFHLRFMMGLKIYKRSQAYIRYRILWDREYWEVWRKAVNS